MNIGKLLDLEKDLREAEQMLRVGFGDMNCVRDEGWYELMEELGFLYDGRFLPIIDIIAKTKDMPETERVFTLESVGCDLSLFARIVF